jgi:hypothetical protein
MHTRRHFIKIVLMGATATTGTPGYGSGAKADAAATPSPSGLPAARGASKAVLTQLRA